MTILSIADDKSVLPLSALSRQVAGSSAAYRTPRALLLAIYAIIPISVLLVLFDRLLLDGRLKLYLPRSPEDLFLFLIVFVQPHIVASAVAFCDTGYLKYYGTRLLPAVLALLALLMFFPSFLHARWFIGVYAVWTAVHFTGQQLGVARMMGHGFNYTHTLWRWSVLLIAVPVYVQMFSLIPMAHAMQHLVMAGIWAALGFFLCISILVWRTAGSKLARGYVIANGVAAITEVSLFCMGYYFFVLLISRVIHDLSAFTFYISHDANRNADSAKNLLYRWLRFLPVPVYVLCPLVAIGLAFPLTWHMPYEWAYRIAFCLTLFHYYTDGFVWKKGTPHREYIRMR